MANTPYICRVILGRRLNEYRNRQAMSVAEAYRKTKVSETKIRKLERGVNDAIRLADIYAFSAVYRCTPDETDHLIELAESADSPGWYHPYDVPPEFAHFIEQQEAASAIHIYEQEFINGLFQIEEYLDQLRANRPRQSDEPDRGLRAQRQENVFEKPKPPEIIYITNEAAIRRQVGGEDVMRTQIARLLELDQRAHISIYVVPFSVGAHQSMNGPYSILYFADDVFPTTVYLESLHGSRYEDEDDIVLHHEEAFAGTRQIAAPIKEFINEHYQLA